MIRSRTGYERPHSQEVQLHAEVVVDVVVVVVAWPAVVVVAPPAHLE